MFARCLAIPRRVVADCSGVTSLEYAVFAAVLVGTIMLSARNLVTALAGIINSFAAAL
jgi:Flp pilus assembly pilin Flp